MKIKILGTRGEIKPSAPKHANHSGILIDGKLMFDVGEKKFLQLKPQAIFITHLHPDHAFFMRRPIIPPSPSYLKRGDLSVVPPLKIRGGEEGLWTNFGEVKIFAPEHHNDWPQIQIISKPVVVGTHKITPIPTIHSKNVKSQAYLIEKGAQRILYTGDMIWIKKRFWKFLKNLDLVITEGSFIKTGGMVNRDPVRSGASNGARKKTGAIWGHQGIPDLIKFFSRFTGRIIITHFGSWFYKDIGASKKELTRLGKENGTEVIAGYDGMIIRVS